MFVCLSPGYVLRYRDRGCDVTQDERTQRVSKARGDGKRPPRTQDQRSAETIARLTDATITLMSEVGYANLTTTSIAKRAGVSRGAMLHHFSSKGALVVHATGWMWGRVVEASETLRAESDPHAPDPDAFVRAMWEGPMAATHVSVSVDIMLAGRGDPLLKAHLDHWIGRMFTAYRDAARHAFGQAGLSEAECDALTNTLASTLRGERIAQSMAPDPARADAVCATLASLVRARLERAAR